MTTEQRKYFPTSSKIVSQNYPYGYTLKTDKTDFLEFSAKHGFRHCSFTVNPKNGRINATKKGKYKPGMVLYQDEKGHVKVHVLQFLSDKEKQKDIQFLADNFDLFTPEQINHFYAELFVRSKVDTVSLVHWAGADFEQVKQIVDRYIHIITAGMKSQGKENLFAEILQNWDFEALENCKVPDYSPLRVKSTHIIGA